MQDFPGGPVVKNLLPMQGVRVRSLVAKLRSHKLHGQKKPEHNRSNIVPNSIKTLNMVHIKKTLPRWIK